MLTKKKLLSVNVMRNVVVSILFSLLALASVPVAAQNPKLKINPVDGAEMVWIPACTFQMGDSDQRYNPIHTVRLSGYYIYRYPVTVGQYRKFCESKSAKMPAAPKWGWQEDHPMVNVSWYDAVAYCNWAGVRLPTEAQWEHAARGPNNYKFPWGNEFDGSKCLNSVKPHAASGTAKVGSYTANDFGLYDMAGNVWNWCQDAYGKYFWWTGEDYNNPVNSYSGVGDRVLRGGAWWDLVALEFRTSTRNWGTSDIDNYSSQVGFRCVSQD
jgi:formylglycine-generating enzyme